MSRRDFVKIVTTLLGSIMTFFLGLPGVAYLIPPALHTSKEDDWISLGPLENYPSGTPTRFNFTRTWLNGWEKTFNSYIS